MQISIISGHFGCFHWGLRSCASFQPWTGDWGWHLRTGLMKPEEQMVVRNLEQLKSGLSVPSLGVEEVAQNTSTYVDRRMNRIDSSALSHNYYRSQQ